VVLILHRTRGKWRARVAEQTLEFLADPGWEILPFRSDSCRFVQLELFACLRSMYGLHRHLLSGLSGADLASHTR